MKMVGFTAEASIYARIRGEMKIPGFTAALCLPRRTRNYRVDCSLESMCSPVRPQSSVAEKAVTLAPGYRGIRLRKNKAAVYLNNSPTGIHLICICASGGYCELLPPDLSGGNYWRCESHGCPDCQLISTQPPGMGGIVRAIQTTQLLVKAP
jgi:hypothetical protein